MQRASPATAATQPGQYAEFEVGVEERRTATILFADLAGFTSMSEGLDPEDVKALAAHCAQIMSGEVRRFGGTVTGIMGDAIMGTFGAPVAHEDDPERAVRAALAMRDRIRSEDVGPKRLDLHVGINTGETMAGLIGPQGRQDYTAMGDTTNTAARFMSNAPTGSILVGEQTYLATRHSVAYREVEPIVAKGKSENLRAFEVLDAAPVPQPRPLGSAPFAGRRGELATVTSLWDRVRVEQRVCSMTVAGAPGIGKTRLLREAIASLEGKPLSLWGRCLSYGEGITYWPVIEMVTAAAAIAHDDTTEHKLAKLGRLIESLPTRDQDELQSIAIALANLLSLPTTPRGTLPAAQISRAELHWGVRRFLELLSARGHLVIVFEDLHWSEPTLLELIEILKQAKGAFLILATTRPDGVSPTADDGEHHRTAQLGGLSDDEAANLLASLTGEAGDRARLERVLRAAGGNPLFLEEMLRMLAIKGGVRSDRSAAELLEEMPVPTSVQGLIGSRLDLLPADEKRMAQHGSVVGQVFWSGAVAAIGGWPPGIDSRLDDLAAREVVEAHLQSEIEGEREYAFRHILIRDVAYGRLPKRERSTLHAACARWLDDRLTQRDEVIEIIAYHWEQACKLAPAIGALHDARPITEALQALSAAGAKAECRDGAREALQFYQRALALAGSDQPEAAVELRVKCARIKDMLGALGDAQRELLEAAEDARQLGLPSLRGQALVTLASTHVKQGRFEEAERELLDAQQSAAEHADRRLHVRAALELAELLGGFEGKTELGIAELRRVIPVAEELGEDALMLEGHLRLAALLFNLGKLRDAEGEAVRAEEFARRFGNHRDRARATFVRGIVALYRSGAEQSRPLAAEALMWNERIGDSYYQLQSVRALAKCELTAGAPQLAATRLREALPLAEQTGGWLGVEIRRCLIEALVGMGRLIDAEAVLADARRTQPPEDEYARAAVLVSDALVSAAGADPGGAWNLFAEALRIMEELQLWLDHAEAQLLYARALARSGLRIRAEEELRVAHRLCEQLQADAMADDIEQQLARLRAEAGATA